MNNDKHIIKSHAAILDPTAPFKKNKTLMSEEVKKIVMP